MSHGIARPEPLQPQVDLGGIIEKVEIGIQDLEPQDQRTVLDAVRENLVNRYRGRVNAASVDQENNLKAIDILMCGALPKEDTDVRRH